MLVTIPRVNISSPLGVVKNGFSPSETTLPLVVTLVGVTEVRVAVPPEIEYLNELETKLARVPEAFEVTGSEK